MAKSNEDKLIESLNKYLSTRNFSNYIFTGRAYQELEDNAHQKFLLLMVDHLMYLADLDRQGIIHPYSRLARAMLAGVTDKDLDNYRARVLK